MSNIYREAHCISNWKKTVWCPDCVRWHRGEGKEMLINLIDGEIKKKTTTLMFNDLFEVIKQKRGSLVN